ncbi:NAD(P)/FAD-dependent oxidoreductase [Geomonas nitrogeniifigens]|uniref:NAD(P)/FAD-dependent oxidoreductase n=1 Tax=Geomonas diazotrophica TaxID=2843197 RepID=A0ABX8JK57_9BACT|nr:NAD(P)/FAD-dependent oxidoreductase [Geomonas nitrogeniifigens]QWV98688.1 NAD(P)/FAD-dependent oxidoreductase [Geomonas nitrogeniifigens]QXE87845.1 NAD(P)/FAD-dependent oxidoreductase [Geomonas nitrogeniifigens]
MPKGSEMDAVVVGSGPNGLAAALTLAKAGLSVTVVEGSATIGGGTRSEELTLPGFLHDVCSAIHPLGVASPFFKSLPLSEHGLEWIYPQVQLAHPLPDGEAALLFRDLDETASLLGRDGSSYRRLFAPLIERWDDLAPDLLAPLHVPRYPVPFALFGMKALLPAQLLARLAFKDPPARALFAGMSAHAFLPLQQPLSAAFGLILGTLGHVAGWPVAKGGSQSIAAALASCLRTLGGVIVTGCPIKSLADLPAARIILFDVSERQLESIAGSRLPAGYRRRLQRYRYGPGVFKIDWALDGAIPWTAAGCRRSATVHVGGTEEEVARGEKEIWRGIHPEQPFVLVAQPTLVDPSRAPDGKHTAWAYCHVPHGSTFDMSDRIESQVERFAPGFRDLILGRHTRNCLEYETYNANIIGGDINGGVQDLRQFLARPTLLAPYRTPLPGVYLCSSGTPPGGGVHGMCGYHAARLALADLK